MYYAATRKRLEDLEIDTEDLYEGYHPLRINPDIANSMTEKETRMLSERGKLIKELGLDKYEDFDD